LRAKINSKCILVCELLYASSSFERVVTIHCLAALDLGEGVEQPIDCLIVQNRQAGQEDTCLHVALPVAAFLEMLTTSFTARAITSTCAGCVRRGMGHNVPFSGRGSRNAAEDNSRLNTLQLNTEGLTANKISVIEQLAYKNKAFIIVLQETHCTAADKLVIPDFSLAGSVLSRNQGLATFVHERLEWSLVDQSPE